jgi:hypothetical protein
MSSPSPCLCGQTSDQIAALRIHLTSMSRANMRRTSGSAGFRRRSASGVRKSESVGSLTGTGSNPKSSEGAGSLRKDRVSISVVMKVRRVTQARCQFRLASFEWTFTPLAAECVQVPARMRRVSQLELSTWTLPTGYLPDALARACPRPDEDGVVHLSLDSRKSLGEPAHLKACAVLVQVRASGSESGRAGYPL